MKISIGAILALTAFACTPMTVPTKFAVVPEKLIGDEKKDIALQISADGWVFAHDKPILQIRDNQIVDANGKVVAELLAEGRVKLAGVERVAQYHPRTMDYLASLDFGGTRVYITPAGSPTFDDQNADRNAESRVSRVRVRFEAPEDGRFDQEHRGGDPLVEVVLVAILFGKPEELNRPLSKH